MATVWRCYLDSGEDDPESTFCPRLDKARAAALWVNHQAGLRSRVRDIELDKSKCKALAHQAKDFKLPTILTTCFETGPNSLRRVALKVLFPQALRSVRPWQINAWGNKDFVRAVKATGKQQLIIASGVSDSGVAFSALSVLAEEYGGDVVADASGTFNGITRQAAWDRMSASGAQLMSWFGLARAAPRLAQ